MEEGSYMDPFNFKMCANKLNVLIISYLAYACFLIINKSGSEKAFSFQLQRKFLFLELAHKSIYK